MERGLLSRRDMNATGNASNGQPVPVRLVFDAQKPATETRSGIFPAVSTTEEHRTRRRVG